MCTDHPLGPRHRTDHFRLVSGLNTRLFSHIQGETGPGKADRSKRDDNGTHLRETFYA